MPRKQVISASLSDELIDAIDAQKKDTLNRSKKIEDLLRDALGMDPLGNRRGSAGIISGQELTDKQKEAARVLIRRKVSDVPASEAVKQILNHGPYSKTHYAKEALKSIHANGDIPIYVENQHVVVEILVCGCGAELSLFATDGGACPSCGTVLIDGL